MDFHRHDRLNPENAVEFQPRISRMREQGGPGAGREIDRLLGLELGADDYICKPVSPREVVARVKAVLRRAGGQPAPAGHGLLLDKDRYQATLHGRDLDLTAIEFQLLHILAGNPGRIFSRGQLMGRIYPDRRVVSDRTIDSHVKKLRRKFAAAAPGEEWIHSLYGVGYKLEAPP
jgi:two-component system response regulator BaeR